MNEVMRSEVATLLRWSVRRVWHGTGYLFPSSAADFLGVSPQTLERWRNSNKGPAFDVVATQVIYCNEALVAYRATMKRQDRKSAQ